MSTQRAAPDWYGRLDVNSKHPTSPPTPATGLWLILYDDWFNPERYADDRTLIDEARAFRMHVQRKFPDALAFDFLPMIFVHCSQAEVESLAHVPRFRNAFPQLVTVEKRRGLASPLRGCRRSAASLLLLHFKSQEFWTSTTADQSASRWWVGE